MAANMNSNGVSKKYDAVMQHRQQLVDAIIENMKRGYIFTPEAWNSLGGRPHNAVTGKPYMGGNAVTLWMAKISHGYKDSRWLTYKQAQSIGAQVKKGESGTRCEKWIFEKTVKEIDPETGKEIKKTVKLEKPIPSIFYVFNAEQVDNLPEENINRTDQPEISELASDFIASSECPIIEQDNEEQAYYRVNTDEIHLPARKYFKDDITFFAVASHEMAHSTGHESRLNRDIKNVFGSDKYALEELRAEFASYFISADMRVPTSQEHFQDHSNYLSSWIEALKNNPKYLFEAINDADKISDRLVSNYDKFVELKNSLSIEEIPGKAMQRLRAELNDNQIKGIIERADISSHHKKMLQVELEKQKELPQQQNIQRKR